MKLPRIRSFRSVIPVWQNALLAIAAAVLLILAFPDFEFWLLAWVALVPLLWAIDREKACVARCFVIGWIFGTIFFFGTCWWLTFAPITYAGFPPVLAYSLLLLVCIAAGIFPAIFGGGMALLLRRFGSAAITTAPFVWIFTEFLRYWITGNNWNAIGYSQAFLPEWTTIFNPTRTAMASIGGVYLVGIIPVLFASIAVYVVIARRFFVGAIGCILVLAIACVGVYRAYVFTYSDSRMPPEIAANVVALQPNVPMSGLTQQKWNELRTRHVRLAESMLGGGNIEGYSHMRYETKEDRKEDEEFLLDEFDSVAAEFSIESLRRTKILADSFEARIWVGNFPDTKRGLILAENSVKFVPPTDESKTIGNIHVQNLTPISGWEDFRSDVAELLNLPDEPPTERIEPAKDSDAVIIEVKKGDDYRFLFYHHPCGSRGENAKKLTRTLANIGDKLGLDFYKCYDESRSKVTQPRPTSVIFPESPMNFMYESDPESREFINGFAARHNVSVLFNSAEPDAATGKFFNSAVMVGPEGREVAQYDKIYLLPFGEAVPFPLDQVMPGFVGNFAYGREYDLLPFGDAKGGVMICFESHFGQLSREYVRNGADVLIEMTNDGYLGPTPVLRQHLANAVFRAVETNRPVLRVTNVGVTAYITENGVVRDQAEPYTEATRVWNVAVSDKSQTFYVRYGDWFAWLCSVVSIMLLGLAIFRRGNAA